MPVSAAEAVLVCAAGFVASIFGIVVGGHSFITVPLMILVGVEPAQAVIHWSSIPGTKTYFSCQERKRARTSGWKLDRRIPKLPVAAMEDSLGRL